MDYAKIQTENFVELLGILQVKGITPTIQACIDVFNDIFADYIVVDMDWELVLSMSCTLAGAKLETFLLQTPQALAEVYE